MAIKPNTIKNRKWVTPDQLIVSVCEHGDRSFSLGVQGWTSREDQYIEDELVLEFALGDKALLDHAAGQLERAARRIRAMI